MIARSVDILVSTKILDSAGRSHAGEFLDGLIRYGRRYPPGQFFARMLLGGLLDRPDRWDSDTALVLAESRPIARVLADSGRSVVNVLGEPAGGWLPRVADDAWAAGRLAAEHLLERNLDRFAFFGLDNTWSRARQEGFTRALAERGKRCELTHFWSDFAEGSRGAPGIWATVHEPGLLRDVVESLPRPVGVLGCNDLAALAVAGACAEVGLRVPEDVSLVGVDNDRRFCELSPTPITSIDRQMEEIGYQSAALLDAIRLGEVDRPGEVLVAPRLIQRRSTEAFVSPSLLVNEAMAFLRNYACEAIGVSDVVEAVGCARRTLEQHFREHVGVGLAEEIRRLRLRRVRELLTHTDLPLADIAVRSGFAGMSHMGQQFRKTFGQTPSAYRASTRPPARPGR